MSVGVLVILVRLVEVWLKAVWDIMSMFDIEGGLVEDESVPSDAASNLEIKPPRTLPRLSPFSLPRVSDDARHRLRLARLQIEAQEKETDAEYSHKLAFRKMELQMEADTSNRRIELEIGAEKEVKLKRLELETAAVSSAQSPPGPTRSIHTEPSAPARGFEVSRNVVLVPQFREAEVDAYFTAFERVATSLKWPKEVWSILLQCKLTGKAQEILAALSLEDSLSYEAIKTAVLRAYGLVPESLLKSQVNLPRHAVHARPVAGFGGPALEAALCQPLLVPRREGDRGLVPVRQLVPQRL